MRIEIRARIGSSSCIRPHKAERGTLPGATRVRRRLYFLRADRLRLVEQGRVPYLGGPSGGT